MKICQVTLGAIALALAASFFPPVAAAEPAAVSPLPALTGIDKKVTVSGLSSGGFFAHQFHVAYSGMVKGAAIVAGGPYACVQQAPFWLRVYPEPALTFALMVCTHIRRSGLPWLAYWLPAAPSAESSAARIRSEHAGGSIDAPSNLAAARVWLWAGGKDEVVPVATVRALKRTYELAGVAGAHIALKEEARANHGIPIEEFGGEGAVPACGVRAPPFLIDCDYDAAKLMLAHLYPENFRAMPGVADRNRLLRFGQGAFPAAAEPRAGMGREGFLYLPAGCTNGAAQCRLHVAFHGCQQSSTTVRDTFYWHGGYNRWAEANDIAVLYPQVRPQERANPDGCWDWWGYTGPDFHRRTGPQMLAVKAMIDRLLGN